MLVDLFASAQRGDFSRTFIDEKGREPDGITTLGHAYNHLRSELATMVHTDPLTGCLNRRGFDQMMGHTVSAAARRGGEVSLLAIDIDHFKAINDTSAIWAATPCCASSSRSSRARRAAATSWRASAARSSSSFCPTPTTRWPAWWPSA